MTLRMGSKFSALRIAVLFALSTAPYSTANVHFEFSVVASSQDASIHSIDTLAPTTNERGDVAFVANTTSDPVGFEAVFASFDSTPPFNVHPNLTAATVEYGDLIQINNSRDIITTAHDATFGTPSFVISYDEGTSDNTTTIAFSGDPGVDQFLQLGNVGISERTPFDAREELFFQSNTGSFLDATLSTPNGSGSFNELPLKSTISAYFAQESGEIVLRNNVDDIAPGVAEGEGDLELRSADLLAVETIASASVNGFSKIGMRPAVSANGNVVLFVGDLSEAGAIALNDSQSSLSYGETPFIALNLQPLSSGPGVFAAIFNPPFGRIFVRIAGVSDNGILDPGESFVDADGSGDFTSGDPISSPVDGFILDSIDGAVGAGNFATNSPSYDSTFRRSMPVLFSGIVSEPPFMDRPALFYTRLIFGGNRDGNQDQVFSTFEALYQVTVRPHVKVVAVGDTIPGLPGTVTEIGVYDSLNDRDRGDIVFGVRTTAGVDAIVRARPQEVFYVEFEPDTNFVPDAAKKRLFESLGAPISWDGSLHDVLMELAPNRADLVDPANFDALKVDIIDKIAAKFEQLDGSSSMDANIRVLEIDPNEDPVPPARIVYIGDGPEVDGSGVFKQVGILGIAPLNFYNNADYATFRAPDEFTTVAPESRYSDGFVSVFADTVFSVQEVNGERFTGLFTSETGTDSTFVALSDETGNVITPEDAANALANVAAHEMSHALGLSHLTLTSFDSTMLLRHFTPREMVQDIDLNPIEVDTIRLSSQFRNSELVLQDRLDSRNHAQRLAFAAGSDSSLNVLPRQGPLNFGFIGGPVRSTILQSKLVSYVGGISVVESAMGFTEHIGHDHLPNFASFGSGELGALLDRSVTWGASSLADETGSILFVASTTGAAIDIYGVPVGDEPTSDEILLENGLGVLVAPGLRSDTNNDFPVFDDSDVLLDIYQKVSGSSDVLIGRLSMSVDEQFDADDDGVEDPLDNCLLSSNSSQLDTDADNYGNLCDGDLNNDGIVNAQDLGILRNAFFSGPGDQNWNPDADMNGDNIVNTLDTGLLKAQFFERPGPSGIQP